MNGQVGGFNQEGHDFPVVGEPESSAQGDSQKVDRKGYQNTIFPNDSLTTCTGFINEIRPHTKPSGETLYFARVGLIQGSRQNERLEWEGDITNCDLLVGSTLKKWAESVANFKDCYVGIRSSFVIRNLKFSPGIHDGKPVLNSRGVLETITLGHIDR